MAKTRAQYICQSCGNVTGQWAGRCDSCSEWNTIVEEQVNSGVGSGPKSAVASGRPVELVALSGSSEDAKRVQTNIAELDRVTGGGFVVAPPFL